MSESMERHYCRSLDERRFHVDAKTWEKVPCDNEKDFQSFIYIIDELTELGRGYQACASTASLLSKRKEKETLGW